MTSRKRTNRRGLWLVALLAWAACAPAWAGLPRPGLILYGQVIDNEGQLVTEGDLVATYTPDTGDPIAVTVPLRAIPGPAETYSYSLVVPIETAVPGFGASGQALLLSDTAQSFERTLAVGTLAVTTSVTLSTADTAAVKRVDVCPSCGPALRNFHSGDTNRDRRFSLSEFLRMIELHTATPTHEYHIDKSTTDGFGLGTGPRSGEPHAADYYGGADWEVSLPEVVRIVDLFASTPDHSYAPTAGTEDGFGKGRGGAKSASGFQSASAQMNPEAPALQLTRSIRGGAPGEAGLQFVFEVQGDTAPLSALGISEALPPGWRYAGATSEAAPLAAPAPGTGGTLDFAWFPVPASGYAFVYEVAHAGSLSLAAGLARLEGTAVYRTVSGEEQTLVTLGPPAGYFGVADTDGDGIGDIVEGPGDADGDGVPNAYDVDSDNDGVSDRDEALHDGDPNYDPYHPIDNPDGTDTSATSGDTDGDGVGDQAENDNDSDPVDGKDTPAELTLLGMAGLASLAGLLAYLGWRRR